MPAVNDARGVGVSQATGAAPKLGLCDRVQAVVFAYQAGPFERVFD